MTRFSVIVPTCGRDTLVRTLASIAHQLGEGDEILVLKRTDSVYGNSSRDTMIGKATGDYLLFMDDDDVFTPDAFQVIRAACDRNPYAVHMFRMRSDADGELWRTQAVTVGNVSGQIVAVPNQPPLPLWAADSSATSDYEWITNVVALIRDVEWHQHVIALIRPD